MTDQEVPSPVPLEPEAGAGSAAPDNPDTHRRLLSNAGIVMGLSIVNATIGIAFQAIIAAHLGAGPTADVFAVGVSLPTVIATAFLSAVPLVFVPRIASYTVDVPGKLLPSSVVQVGAALCFAFALTVCLASPLLAHAVAPGFGGRKEHATVEFLRLTSPVVVLSAFAALGQSLAYHGRRFVRASAGAAINGVGLLGSTVILFGTHPDSSQLAIATTLGYVAQALWMVPELLRNRGGWDRDGKKHLERTIITAVLVLTGASLIYKGQPVIERTVASTVGPGSAAVMSYSLKIANGLLLFSVALATVAMPSFARSIAGRADDEAVSTLKVVLTLVFGISVVIAAFVLLASDDIVRILFGRGDLSLASESRINAIVRAYLIFLTANAVSGPIVNVHYAYNRQKWVAMIGLAGMFWATVFSIALAWPWGVVGVAVGTGIGSLLPVGVFSATLSSRLKPWSWHVWARENVSMFGTVGGGFILAYTACAILPLGLPARGQYLALLGVLLAKGAILILGFCVAAPIFRWHPRQLLGESTRLRHARPAGA